MNNLNRILQEPQNSFQTCRQRWSCSPTLSGGSRWREVKPLSFPLSFSWNVAEWARRPETLDPILNFAAPGFPVQFYSMKRFPLNLFKNYLSARREKLIHRIGYNLCSLSAPNYQFRLNLNNKEAKVVKYWCLAPFWKETPVLCSWWRAALNTLPQVWHRQATPILISIGSSRREADTEGVFLFRAWLIFLYHIGGLTARAHSITSPCDLL